MTKEELDMILDNDREWRGYILKSIDEIKETLQVQNGRVRSLEVWRGKIIGISIVVAGIMGWLADKISEWF